jgi:serine phosphatase RsbU (regulator of sigma subunit)
MYFPNIYKSLFFFIFLVFNLNVFKAGNPKKLDSLYTILKTSSSDTVKVNAQVKIAALLLRDDSVKGYHEIRKALQLISALSDKDFALKSIDKIGRACYSNGLLQKARMYWEMGLGRAKSTGDATWQAKFFMRIGDWLQHADFSKQCIAYFDSALKVAGNHDEKLLANIYMGKGRAHYDIGDYKTAMDHYIKAQRIFEKNQFYNVDYGHLLHFIGSVFKRQGFYDKALIYYEKELALARQIKNRSLEAESLYLCAAMYGSDGDLDKELDYELKALEIYKEEGNKKSMALMLSNISSNYADKKDYKKAIACCEEALELYKQTGDSKQESWVYRALGDYYSKTGLHKKALTYLKKAMATALQVETKQLLYRAEITESMAFAYSRIGDYKSAFNTYLDYRKLDDSLSNKDNKEYLSTLEKQYETEKKEKEIALLNKDKQMQGVELARHQTQRNALVVGCILVLLIAVISIVAFINKQKTSRLLIRQVNEINYQNAVIKEKNKDITDSIQYAKRLQEAVFPEADTLNNYFAESFVLFRPKDIVSGDFYWFEEINGKSIIIVGDCTGHGVPGAFMSILGHNLLNQIILEDEVIRPAEILTLLDKRVSNALNKRGSKQEYNDGMDIAVCVIDKNRKILSYAGANRPLILKRDSGLMELKPNKYAVGGIQDTRTKEFTQHDMLTEKNDTLYLFSDGYYDQFGGPNGKKFKYKHLNKLILDICALPLKEQSEILNQRFQDWMGQLEQIDDVCVIGIRI